MGPFTAVLRRNSFDSFKVPGPVSTSDLQAVRERWKGRVQRNNSDALIFVENNEIAGEYAHSFKSATNSVIIFQVVAIRNVCWRTKGKVVQTGGRVQSCVAPWTERPGTSI
jgi:hypothetical protein